ncbi:unnamed protein product [Orchesella dallaii]|uniref:L-Fucosyltransferase n=1 Tax=Orchesella dallaii TaxID=48710 RepID=A0ABP1S7U3_9HEXA
MPSSSSTQLTSGLRLIFFATGFTAFILLTLYAISSPAKYKTSSDGLLPNFNIPKGENRIEELPRRTHYNQTLSPPGVIYRMKGGIGNQLFEYACSYALARERNWTMYTFYIASSEPSRVFKQFNREFALDHFRAPLDDMIDNTTELSGVTYVSDEELLDKSYQEPKEFIQQYGYCQSEVYFGKYVNEIREMFRPRLEFINVEKLQKYIDLIRNSESVAVHVRRGDFTYITGFFIPMSYQRMAIRKMASLFQKRGKTEPPVFFIFSDDIAHTKKKLKDFEGMYKFVYVSDAGFTSIEDFYLMLLCKHNIIPNSTFSWWAAYLNENPDKIVIASAFNPEFWRLFEANEKNKRFYMKLHGTLYHPKDWVVIDSFSGGLIQEL